MSNPPLVHQTSTDTRAVDDERRAAVPELHSTLPEFARKYGVEVEHFLNLYFSESAFIHRDQIVQAVNALAFDEVDFVFDDFRERLATRTIDNCGIVWCRMRDRCPYVAPAGAVARQ